MIPIQDPLVSVIVPIYGVEAYIERCARSLFEQTYQNIEYIFVNDCTRDQSVQILKSIILEYPERVNCVQIINLEENHGLAYVRRVGVDAATGKYLIHCDSDDWVEPTIYELLVRTAERDSAEITICDFYFESINSHEVYHYRSDITPHQYINLVSERVWWSQWNRLYLTDFIRRNELYTYPGMNMWEDMYVSVRANYYARIISYVQFPLYHYDISRDSSLVHKKLEDSIINQQILCVKMLESFFSRVGFDASPFLDYRKRMIKNKYLQKAPADYVGFQSCFPELTTYGSSSFSFQKWMWESLAKGYSWPYRLYYSSLLLNRAFRNHYKMMPKL